MPMEWKVNLTVKINLGVYFNFVKDFTSKTVGRKHDLVKIASNNYQQRNKIKLNYFKTRKNNLKFITESITLHKNR